ncbi:hypothetical protein IW262DRAFT_1297783 [Armillaria fumosa]|nr:hypothetical protein IW262DRAFT_1297783 [Armillaria fumosa]
MAHVLRIGDLSDSTFTTRYRLRGEPSSSELLDSLRATTANLALSVLPLASAYTKLPWSIVLYDNWVYKVDSDDGLQFGRSEGKIWQRDSQGRIVEKARISSCEVQVKNNRA